MNPTDSYRVIHTFNAGDKARIVIADPRSILYPHRGKEITIKEVKRMGGSDYAVLSDDDFFTLGTSSIWAKNLVPVKTEESYQPKKGDIVKAWSPETPASVTGEVHWSGGAYVDIIGPGNTIVSIPAKDWKFTLVTAAVITSASFKDDTLLLLFLRDGTKVYEKSGGKWRVYRNYDERPLVGTAWLDTRLKDTKYTVLKGGLAE